MNINYKIAKTYIFSNKKLTAVGVLGVLLGMSVYIFMNSLMVGFDRTSNTTVFKNTAHIRVYKDDEISKPLIKDSIAPYLIINPKIVPKINTIINPKKILQILKNDENVVIATPQVNTNVFYNNGKSQISGTSIGIIPEEANNMFDIKSTMVEGHFDHLIHNPNGIIIGSGVAEKMNLTTGDNINITSSKGINRTLKIIGIFKTNNYNIDKIKSYINMPLAQQILKEGNTYITDINVKVADPETAEPIAAHLTELTGYNAESWQKSNETIVAAGRMRKIIISFVSFTILLIAGFGIYNILNMTVSQKINDIAILKAMGFKGNDVVRIFVTQAISIGVMGVIGGVAMATVVITLLKKVYIGGDIGYFPINYESTKYLQGIIIGLVITFFAGYIPAKKAANVDPVEILRR
jgi:lipoprotein-releasing system permease protein